MNRLLVFNISILAILIFCNQSAIGQDQVSTISGSWKNLKTQLLRRADISINIASGFDSSKRIDKKIVDKITLTATDLKQFLDTVISIDSLAIQKAYESNHNLTRALSPLLAVLITDEKFKQTVEARNLQTQLEGMENRIMVAKRKYNDACNEFKRSDLLFDSNQKPKSTQISL